MEWLLIVSALRYAADATGSTTLTVVYGTGYVALFLYALVVALISFDHILEWSWTRWFSGWLQGRSTALRITVGLPFAIVMALAMWLAIERVNDAILVVVQNLANAQ